jgi:hypothetical protein
MKSAILLVEDDIQFLALNWASGFWRGWSSLRIFAFKVLPSRKAKSYCQVGLPSRTAMARGSSGVTLPQMGVVRVTKLHF